MEGARIGSHVTECLSAALAVRSSTALFSPADCVMVAQSRRNYGVSPDGQRFLFILRAKSSAYAQLVVVENWFEELKAKAAK